MDNILDESAGARAFRIGNPSIFGICPILASMEVCPILTSMEVCPILASMEVCPIPASMEDLEGMSYPRIDGRETDPLKRTYGMILPRETSIQRDRLRIDSKGKNFFLRNLS